MDESTFRYSWTSDEAFLRCSIFICLVGIVCALGAVISLYFAIGREVIAALLLAFLLPICLACLFSSRRRVRDMREGPSYVSGVVTNLSKKFFGFGSEIEVSLLSGTKPQRCRFQVANQDFAHIPFRGQLRLLRYPHSGVTVSVQRFNYETQEFVDIRAGGTSGGVWIGGTAMTFTLMRPWFRPRLTPRVGTTLAARLPDSPDCSRHQA